MVTRREFLADHERRFLEQALDGVPSSDYPRVARALGMGESTLYRRIVRLGVFRLVSRANEKEEPPAASPNGAITENLFTHRAPRFNSGTLRLFGYRGRVLFREFWRQDRGELEWVFRECRRHYLKLLKQHHPDNGGSNDKVVAINAQWEVLERRFRKARII